MGTPYIPPIVAWAAAAEVTACAATARWSDALLLALGDFTALSSHAQAPGPSSPPMPKARNPLTPCRLAPPAPAEDMAVGVAPTAARAAASSRDKLKGEGRGGGSAAREAAGVSSLRAATPLALLLLLRGVEVSMLSIWKPPRPTTGTDACGCARLPALPFVTPVAVVLPAGRPFMPPPPRPPPPVVLVVLVGAYMPRSPVPPAAAGVPLAPRRPPITAPTTVLGVLACAAW